MSDPVTLTDEDIVDRIRSGNRDLYAVIMERYSPKLMRYVLNLVHDDDQATHIVQDTFIKSYINLSGFDHHKKFSSWIYRIAHNEALNIIKKGRKEVPLLVELEFASEEDLIKSFEEKETSEQVQKYLNALPLIYSEILNLFYLEEKSYQEISDILRIPVGTVAIRLSRAKKLMKNLWTKN